MAFSPFEGPTTVRPPLCRGILIDQAKNDAMMILAGAKPIEAAAEEKDEATMLKRRGRFQPAFWVRALLVGVLLAGEVHLVSAEILHHHAAIVQFCRYDFQGGPYLHTSPGLDAHCPLCQIVRSSSVIPAVQPIVQKPYQETAYNPRNQSSYYSRDLTSSLQARAPPLS